MKSDNLGLRFSLLQAGTSLGMISSHIFRLAMAWWCLEETQSALAFSSLIALSVAAEIYLTPFLASFGDHFNRIKLLIFCQILLLAVIIILYVANIAGYFNLKVVTFGMFIISAIISLREPTMMGLIPDVVADGKVTQAISSRTAINSVIMLLGPVLAASIISLYSISITLFISISTLSVSCLLYVFLLAKSIKASIPHSKNESWFMRTKGAFSAIYRVKSELYIALMCTVINFTMYPFFSITVPYWINTELRLPVSYLGAFEFSFALGLIMGSLYLNRYINALIGRFYNVMFGFLLLGSGVMTIALTNNIYIAIALAFFCGMAFIFININLSTLRSAATPQDYRTRMSAMAVFLSRLINPLGVAIAGWYINWAGVISYTAISGLIVLIIGPMMLCSLHLKKALSLNETEMKGYYGKAYPEAFYKRL